MGPRALQKRVEITLIPLKNGLPDGHLVKAKAAILIGPSTSMISSWNVVMLVLVVVPVRLNQTKLLFKIYILIEKF